MVTFCPTPSEAGITPETTVKPGPVIDVRPMLTAAVPVFVTVKLCVAVLPIPTFPNATVARLPDKTPVWPVLVLAPVYPTQPASPPIATIATRNAMNARGPRFTAVPSRAINV
jgi:hypothetical protein